jgi:hypothetical protein
MTELSTHESLQQPIWPQIHTDEHAFSPAHPAGNSVAGCTDTIRISMLSLKIQRRICVFAVLSVFICVHLWLDFAFYSGFIRG